MSAPAGAPAAAPADAKLHKDEVTGEMVSKGYAITVEQKDLS